MPVGYWCPVLHAHLPYVRHPEYPQFLEEDWFFEALTETYIPLVSVLDGLLADGVEYRLTMTLSPAARLDAARTASSSPATTATSTAWWSWPTGRSSARSRQDRRFQDLARFYSAELRAAPGDLPRDLRLRPPRARSASTATRGSWRSSPAARPTASCPSWTRCRRRCGRRSRSARQHYRRHFGRDAAGHLAAGVRATCPGHETLPARGRPALQLPRVARAHRRASAAELRGARAHRVAREASSFFGRDMESSRQVWSAESGYPGDVDYREFYKDVGWELPLDYLEALPGRRAAPEPGDQVLPGHGQGRARRQAALRARAGRWRRRRSHAGDFLGNRQRQVEHLAASHGPASRSW